MTDLAPLEGASDESALRSVYARALSEVDPGDAPAVASLRRGFRDRLAELSPTVDADSAPGASGDADVGPEERGAMAAVRAVRRRRHLHLLWKIPLALWCIRVVVGAFS